MAGDINVVAIIKGEERYVFLFDDDSRAETLRTLGRYASDSELSFSWYDAAVLSQKVRKSSQPASAVEFDECRRMTPSSGTSETSGWPLFDDFPPLDDLWLSDEPFA